MLGWPLLVHYCNKCTYNTTVDYSATVWTQEHTCSHCGHKSVGADISGHSAAQMTQSQHDELAALFSQRMTFAPTPVSADAAQVYIPVEVMQDNKDDMQADAQPVHFVSAHYTHSTHIRPTGGTTSEPSRSPPPSYAASVMPEAMAQLFRENSIDPSSLLPNQVQLFSGADYEQRLRLLELWRIAPPSYLPREEHVDASWMPTSMQQEEMLAKVRYETTMATRAVEAYRKGWQRQGTDFDTHVDPEPMSPIREAGETAWPPAARMRAASIANSRTTPRVTDEAEPYIITGYQNAHSDPVYGAAPKLWQSPSFAHAGQVNEVSMEDQYGNLMQIRNHAEWEAMNERMAAEKLAILLEPTNGSLADDDMVM